MSHPWSKRIRLHLGLRTAQATLEGPWPRRTPISFATTDLVTPDEAAARSAVDALLDQLGQGRSLRQAALDVVLSDALVHLDVASGRFGEFGAAALEAVAEACVVDMLGQADAPRLVRWRLQPDERHLVIGAFDARWVAMLAAAARRHGLRPDRIEPAFSRAWDDCAGQAGDAEMMFVSADLDHTVVACVRDHSICALSRGRALDESRAREDLDLRVDRLLAGSGLDASAMGRFVAVVASASTLPEAGRWKVIRRPAHVAVEGLGDCDGEAADAFAETQAVEMAP